MRMAAYGRKQTLRLSLNGCSLTCALEKKADIWVLELRARVNGRNRPIPDVRSSAFHNAAITVVTAKDFG